MYIEKHLKNINSINQFIIFFRWDLKHFTMITLINKIEIYYKILIMKINN